jgi:hypothetical protein
MKTPPGPANGAAHILQRGELGIRMWIRRINRNGDGPVSIARHRSSAGAGGGLSLAVIGEL